MIDAGNPEAIYSKHKAITTLFPYAVWRKRGGHHEMFDTFLRAASICRDEWGFMWVDIIPHFATLLDEERHGSLKQAAILASPHLLWGVWGPENDKRLVQQWAAAALAVPYTDEVDQSIADTLL